MKKKHGNHPHPYQIYYDTIKEFLYSLILFLFGWHGPHYIIWPWVGGVRIRPIPYQMTQDGDVLLDFTLSHDLVTNVRFSGSLLMKTCFWSPLVILLLVTTAFSKYTHAPKSQSPPIAIFHCFFCAVGINKFSSEILKMYIGRLRPNFYAMCGFNSDPTILKCTADLKRQYEARQSFPSGHSGLSFCSMGVLTWFALGCWIKICHEKASSSSRTHFKSNSNKNVSFADAMMQTHAKLGVLLALSPLAFSTFVATSRIADHWHHPTDVMAGAILGFVCATISYHLWFHSIFSEQPGCPMHYSTTLTHDDGDAVKLNSEVISLTERNV